MNTIRPEDSSEDNLSLPSSPRYRRKSRRKYFSAYDFSRSPSLSPVRRKTSKNKTKMNKNANANVANDVGQDDSGQNGKLDEAQKGTCVHRWTLMQVPGPYCSEDIIRVMKSIQPLLNESLHIKNGTTQQKVDGPLTWRQFHR